MAARPAVRRRRRERHGALSRLRGFLDLFEASAGLSPRALLVDPGGATAALRKAREVRLGLDVQVARLAPGAMARPRDERRRSRLSAPDERTAVSRQQGEGRCLSAGRWGWAVPGSANEQDD